MYSRADRDFRRSGASCACSIFLVLFLLAVRMPSLSSRIDVFCWPGPRQPAVRRCCHGQAIALVRYFHQPAGCALVHPKQTQHLQLQPRSLGCTGLKHQSVL